MKKIIFCFIICLFSFAVYADVFTDLEQLTSETGYLKNDLTKISGFINSELTKQILLNGTAGTVFPGNTCTLPGVEFGAQLGISAGSFNVEGLKSLKYDYLPQIDTDNADIPKYIPLPAGAFHVKSGFFPLFGKETDLGIRFLALDFGINQEKVKMRAQHYIFGLEQRYMLVKQTETSPFGVTGALSLDYLSGRVKIALAQDTSDTAEINGTPYDIVTDGQVVVASEWNVQTVGMKLVLNKELFFFNPFAGLGLNFNFGNYGTTAGIESYITITKSGDPGNTATEFAEVKAPYSSTPSMLDARLIMGFEIGIAAFKWNVTYEWAGEVFSLMTGIRFQI
ncbi:MAG: hypothetical protein CVV21_12075 [Candidatus Goldiibacteriota bacterium HGW-Goldbacteria-1]|jgi:hypothetical protein|nr:MAG: hypothetical protein CVV21_12075 [Candidatus Goldiibacteriota bacterium HGW-Goldbacteria-1]